MLDENVPHNDVDGGVLIISEQAFPLVWIRTGGHANVSIIETRIHRAATVLASQTMPTEAYTKMRAPLSDR
jgi:hypothetical protein